MASKGDDKIEGVGGINSLMEQIKLAKQELTHHFQSYHRMLYEKEHAVLSELDAILMAANDLQEKRRELKQTQGELEEKMKRNEFQAMKSKILEVVSVELRELEHAMSVSDREVVELEWKDSELLAAIQESCVMLKRDPTVVHNPTISPTLLIPYSDRQVPLWSSVTQGSEDGQLESPKYVAVDPENEDIYVADHDNNRIAVFSKDGIFVRNFTVKGMIWPRGIVVTEFCYITTTSEGLILKTNKKTGEKISSLVPGGMLALTLDKETGMLFGCSFHNPSIWFIHPENLEKVSELTLNTPHFIKYTTKLYDLKTLKDELYILFISSPYPLQSFSRDGNLLKTIIPQNAVNYILNFCIDFQGSFIVSDNSAHKILVFSSTGDFIATIGRAKTEEREPGELFSPRGIALTKIGRIVVCDSKKKNMLQLF